MLEVLSKVYGGFSREYDQAPPVWWAGQYRVDQVSTIDQFKAVHGHFSYGCHPSVPFRLDNTNGAKLYATMLRDPVDRVVSLFYYRRSLAGGGSQPWLGLGYDYNTTLEEYVKTGRDVALFNAQTAQLAGIRLDTHFNPTKIPDRDDFNIAQQNMRYIVAGILEDISASVAAFAKQWHWPGLVPITHETPLKRKLTEHHDPTTLDLIREYNQFDAMLYKQAKEQLLS